MLLCLILFDNELYPGKHKLSTSTYNNGIASNKILGECAMFRASFFVTYMIASSISDSFESKYTRNMRARKKLYLPNNAALMKDVWGLDLLRNPFSLTLSFDESHPVFVQCSYTLLLLVSLFFQGKAWRSCLSQISCLL